MKRLSLVLIPIVAILFLAVACGDDDEATPIVIEKEVVKEIIKEVPVPTFNLKWVTTDDTAQRNYDEFLRWATEIIPERSNGRLRFRVLTVAELGVSGAETLRLLEAGAVDITQLATDHLSGEFPIIEGTDLAGSLPKLDIARAAAEAWRPVVNNELKSKGVTLLNTYPFGAQVFICNGAVRGLEDIQGKKTRAAAAAAQKLLNYMDIEAVFVPWAELFTGLERGVVDCAVTGAAAMYSARFYEIADSLFTLPIGWATSYHGMNLESLEELPTDLQELLVASFEEMGESIWDKQSQWDQEAVACLSGKGDCPLGEPGDLALAEPTSADFELVAEAVGKVTLPDWLSRCPECKEKWNQIMAPITGVRAE